MHDPHADSDPHALADFVERAAQAGQWAELVARLQGCTAPVLSGARQAAWAGLVGVLARVVKQPGAPDAAKKVALACLGRVFENALGRPEDAVEAWRRHLLLDPADLLPIGPLTRLLGADGRWADLVDLLEARAAQLSDPVARAHALVEIGILCRDRVGAVNDALFAWRAALQADPHNAEAAVALEALLAREGRWRELAELLAWQVETARDDAQGIAARTRLAEVLHDRLGDGRAAAAALRPVLDLRPDHVPTLDRLCALYRELEDWGACAEVMGREAWLLADPDERLVARCDVARLLDEKLDDPHGAFDWYGSALEEQPSAPGLRSIVGRLAERTGRHTEYARILQLAAGVLTDASQRRDVLRELARVQWEHLEDPSGAEATLEALLAEAPADHAALAALDALLLAQARWPALAEVLARRAALAGGDARADLCCRLGQLYESYLSDLPRAVERYREALQVSPEHPRALARLEAIHLAAGDWSALFEIYGRRAAAAAPAERARLHARMARLAEELVERGADAVALWARVLDDAPEDEEALAGLERLYAEHQDWAALDALLRGRLGGVEGTAERRSAWLRLADKLSPAPARALAALCDAFREAPDDAAFGPLLAEVADRSGDLPSVCALYEEALASAPEPAPLRLRLAGWYRELGQEARAGEHLRAVLARAPDHAAARAALEALYGRLQRWGDLVELLESAPATGPVERAARLVRVAEVVDDHLDDPDRAVEAWQRALDADPESLPALTALARLLEGAGRWRERAEVGRRHLALARDADEEAALRVGLGRVYAGPLGEPEQALAVLEPVLDARPDDIETLRTLIELCGAVADWRGCIRLMMRELALLQDPFERLELTCLIGRVYEERLGDREQALGWFGRAYVSAPHEAGILDAVYGLAEQLDRFDRLAAVYEEALAAATDPALRRSLRQALAEVRWHRLQDADGALALWRAALAEDAEDEAARAGLWAALAATARWPELAALAEASGQWRAYAELLDGFEPRSVDLHLAAAEVFAARLDDPTAAIRHLEAAVALAPEHPVARAALAGRLRAQAELEAAPEAAVEIWHRVLALEPHDRSAWRALAALYERLERWDDLVGALSRLVKLTDDPRRQAALHRRRGELLGTWLMDADGAIAAHEAALALDPASEADRLALAALYRDAGRFGGVITLLRDEPMTGDAEVARRLALAYAWRVGRKDPAAALDALEPVLDIAPEDREVLALLAGLYEEVGDWPGAVATLAREARLLTDPGARAARYQQAGRLCATRLRDPARAFEWFARAVDEAPGDGALREELLAAAEASARLRDAVALLVDVLRARRAPDAGALAHVLARLQRDRLGDEAGAEQTWRHVLKAIDPADTDALSGLDSLLHAQERWVELADVLARRVAVEPGNVTLRVRLADLYQDRLGRPDEARRLLAEAAAARPDDRETLARLASLHEAEGDFEALYEVLARWVAVAPEAEGPSLRRRLARLAADSLDRPAVAMAWYEAVLADAPADAEAEAALEALYRADGRWQALDELWCRRLEQRADPAERQAIHRHRAALAEQAAGDPARAFAALLAAFAEVPDDRLAPDLARLAEGADAWDALVDAYEAAIAACPPEEAVALHLRLAEWLDARLGRGAAARRHYAAVLAARPDHADAARALQAAAERDRDWPTVVDMLRRRAATADPVTARGLRTRAAELLEARLDDPAGAADVWAEILADEPPLSARRAAARLYGRLERWAALADALAGLADAVPDPVEAAALRLREARLAEERLDDPARALAGLVAALACEATATEARAGVARLCRAPADWARVVALCEARLATGEDAPAVAALLDEACRTWLAAADPQGGPDALVPLARLVEARLGRPAVAVGLWERIARARPADTEASAALERLHRTAGDWEAVLRVLRRRAALANSPEARRLLYEEMADILERRLGSRERALLTLGEAFAEDPDDARYGPRLARLAAETRAWPDLIEIYEAALDEVGGMSAAVPLHLRVAGWCEALERLDDAARHLAAARAVAPADPEVLAALAELAERRSDVAGAVAAWRLAAAHAVDRLEPLVRVAELLDAEGSPEDAIEAWRAVLAEQELAEARRALARLYEATARWPDFVASLEAQAAAEADPRRAAALLRRAAAVAEERLGDGAQAIALLVRALAEAPDDEAADRLARLYAAADRPADLAALYEARLAALGEAAAFDLRIALADLYLGPLAAPERAAACLETARRYRHVPALERLATLHAARGEEAAFAGVLADLVQALDDAPARRAALRRLVPAVDASPTLARRLAEALDRQANDPGAAFDLLLAAFGETADDRTLGDALELLAERTGRWPALLAAWRAAAEERAFEPESVPLNVRAARWCLERFDDPDGAVRCYQAVLFVDRTHRGAHRALTELLAAADSRG